MKKKKEKEKWVSEWIFKFQSLKTWKTRKVKIPDEMAITLFLLLRLPSINPKPNPFFITLSLFRHYHWLQNDLHFFFLLHPIFIPIINNNNNNNNNNMENDSSSAMDIKGTPTYDSKYLLYNVLGSFFEVSAKYSPSIQPVGRGAYGIVW